MSEITIMISQSKHHWISSGLPQLYEGLSVVGAGVTFSESDEVVAINVTFDKSLKNEVLCLVKTFLADAYCTCVKKEYLNEKITKTGIDRIKRETLIRALTAFDGENDRRIVGSALKIGRIFNVDGFYNFKLKLLRNGWDDLCVLAQENMPLAASNDGAYDLLLRFLLSTVEPKNETVRIRKEACGYKIFTEKNKELECDLSASELIDSLVDIAPMEIVCDESVIDGKLISRLSGIFDIKRVNNLLYFCENR